MADESIRADARKLSLAELARRGIPFSEEHFLRQVRCGNLEIVDSMIRAGISPDAALDGESALSTAAKSGHRPVFELLLKAGADPVRAFDGLSPKPATKNTWEKLSSLGG